MIKFNHVFKIYERDIKALDDINFTIKKGEFVFITGPSGAGKTTILNLLYREDTPDMGAVFVNNEDIAHISDRKLPFYRRNIGFVFQDFKLLFDRSVFDNIALPLVITKTERKFIKNKVEEYIEKAGLSGKENLTPWHLSGGEKQKVAIIRAFITNPSLILADEPTGNLDDESSWEIMKMFEEANQNGTTILFATHNKELLQKMNKRIIKLNKGRIVSDESI